MYTYELSSGGVHVYFCTSTTCRCCSIFKLFHKDSYQIWRVQLAAVHATNECVQTAQLEEARSVQWTLERAFYMSPVYEYTRNALAGFILKHFSACLAWWVQHQQKQIKFRSLKLACHINLTCENFVIPQKFFPMEKKAPYGIILINTSTQQPYFNLCADLWP